MEFLPLSFLIYGNFDSETCEAVAVGAQRESEAMLAQHFRDKCQADAVAFGFVGEEWREQQLSDIIADAGAVVADT